MVNVFSFCLFGPVTAINGRVERDDASTAEVHSIPGGYYNGLEENIQIINKHYPSWYIYVYLGEDVPEWFAKHLLQTYKKVILRRTGILGFKNTVHRFFAIDEPGVDAMFVRDCDGRINWKDRWVVDYFMKQQQRDVLIIRDHREHNSMAAGAWGVRKACLKQTIRSLFDAWTPVFAGNGDPANVMGYGIDQNFLSSVFYPLHLNDVFVMHSFGIVRSGEIGANIPYHWTNDIYVGRIETKPVTENFWLRERDIPPPEEMPIVITDHSLPPRRQPPPKPVFSFLNRSISGSGK